jgi:hypothetical protein
MQLRVAHDHRGAPLPEPDVAEFEIARSRDQLLLGVEAPYYGDPAPDQPVGSTDRLWEHELCELFIANAGDEYLEIELGPHGHFLVLQLRGIRHVVQSQLPIEYRVRIEPPTLARGARYQGRALIPLAYLPPQPSRINGYLIHGVGLARKYCVHRPTHADPPDFHRPEHFAPWQLP